MAITYNNIRRETATDPVLSQVIQRLTTLWMDEDFFSELQESSFAKKRLDLSVEHKILLWGR